MSGVCAPWPGNRNTVGSVSVGCFDIGATVAKGSAGGKRCALNSPARGAVTAASGALCRRARCAPCPALAVQRHRRRQPELLRALDRLGTVAGAELAIDRARVLLDGVRREVERSGDLAVGLAAGDVRQHLALAR